MTSYDDDELEDITKMGLNDIDEVYEVDDIDTDLIQDKPGFGPKVDKKFISILR